MDNLFLLNIVKEKYVVNIINDYVEDLNLVEKYNNTLKEFKQKIRYKQDAKKIKKLVVENNRVVKKILKENVSILIVKGKKVVKTKHINRTLVFEKYKTDHSHRYNTLIYKDKLNETYMNRYSVKYAKKKNRFSFSLILIVKLIIFILTILLLI
jgi:hypothetical protein